MEVKRSMKGKTNITKNGADLYFIPWRNNEEGGVAGLEVSPTLLFKSFGLVQKGQKKRYALQVHLL